MARYIDADELYKAAQKRIAEANEARMAVVDDEFLDLINDAFTEDVAPRAEWISVKERLPDLYGTYLVYTYDNHIKLGYFCELVIGLPPSFDDFDVTHWMPLPEPPKES